jgi:hypothetical protein
VRRCGTALKAATKSRCVDLYEDDSGSWTFVHQEEFWEEEEVTERRDFFSLSYLSDLTNDVLTGETGRTSQGTDPEIATSKTPTADSLLIDRSST